MTRLLINLDEQQLDDDQLREGLSVVSSNNEAMRFFKTMMHLMKSGDLGFWMSPRLTRKIQTYDQNRQGSSKKNTRWIDVESFFSFLQEGGNIEPNVRWEVESLPNNGGIYRMLLQGEKNG